VVSGYGGMSQAKGESPVPMAAGEQIIQPPGWIHTIANTGEHSLVSDLIVDDPDDEHCSYSDSDKWAWAGSVQRLQKVGCWDGGK